MKKSTVCGDARKKPDFDSASNENDDDKNEDETKVNSKQWWLFDSTATASFGMNTEMFHIEEHVEDKPGIIGNGGTSAVNKTWFLDGFSGMPFNKDDIANSLVFIDVIDTDSRIAMDTQEEMKFFVTSPDDDMTQNLMWAMTVHFTMICGMTQCAFMTKI